MTRMRKAALVGMVAVLAASAAGCGKAAKEQRATFKFYTDGVKLMIDYLKSAAIEKPQRDAYGIQYAVQSLDETLRTLPDEIDVKAEDKKEERKQNAEKLTQYYKEKMRGELLSLQYDNAKVQADFDELYRLLDKVVNP